MKAYYNASAYTTVQLGNSETLLSPECLLKLQSSPELMFLASSCLCPTHKLWVFVPVREFTLIQPQ